MKLPILSFLLLLGSLATHAQYTKVTGFKGGNIRDLAYIGGVLYVQNGGVGASQLFKSTDVGNTWQNISPGNRMYPYTNVRFNKLGTKLFLGAYYTTNNGASWSVNGNIGIGNERTCVSNGIAYYWQWASGNERQIYRSADTFATAVPIVNATVPRDTNFNFRNMFVTTGGIAIQTKTGLFHTTNMGNTWQPLSLPVSGAAFGSIRFLKVSGNDIYYRLASEDSIHVSADLGATWKGIYYQYYDVVDLIRGPGSKYYICSPQLPVATADLAVSPASTILTGNFNGFAGTGMALFNPFGKLLYIDNTTVLMTTENLGLVKLNPVTSTYTQLNNGLALAGTTIIGGNSTVTLAFKKDHNYEKSLDKGVTWKDDTANIIHRERGQPVSALLSYNNKLYTGATGYERVFVSSDNAQSWKEIPKGLDVILAGLYGGVLSMGVHKDTVFAGSNNGYVYKLVKDSVWIPVGHPSPANNAVKSVVSLGNSLFAATDQHPVQWGSIYKSTNNGVTWTDVSGGTNLYAVTSMVASGGKLFAACADFRLVRRSNDSGATWQTINNGLPVNGVIDRLQPFQSRVYGISTSGGLDDSLFKLWYYDIPQNKWFCESCTQPNLDITSYWVTDSVIYLGTDGDGVWRKRVTPQPTGVELFEKDNDDITIYPNPSQAPVVSFRHFERYEGAEVIVRNQLGQVAHRERIYRATQPLGVPALPDGIYYIELVKGGQILGFNKWLRQ